MKKYFEFKKQRSFDNIVESTFKFFRNHIKPMMLIVWKYNKITLIGLVLSYFLYSYYSYNMLGNVWGALLKQDTTEALTKNSNPMVSVINLVFLIFSFIFFTRFTLTVYAYIKSYIEHKGQINEREIMRYVSDKFWPFVGASILLGILLFFVILVAVLIFAGLSVAGSVGVVIGVLLFVPLFFYILVFANLFYSVYLLDNVQAGDTISITMKYLKNKFWFSFLVLAVIWIIILMLGSVFQAPLFIVGLSKGLLAYKDPQSFDLSTTENLVIAFFSVISLAGQTILKVLSLIGSAILFFTLKEYHTNEGLLEKLDEIGNTDEENTDI